MSSHPAYGKVKRAIRDGLLTRPEICEVCGKEPPVDRDGRRRIYAHHHRSYDLPLDVQWLCARCHRAVTPLPEKMGAPVHGSRNGQSKLTERDVRKIRLMRRSGMTQEAVAQRFSVTRKVISFIDLGQAWNHVHDK